MWLISGNSVWYAKPMQINKHFKLGYYPDYLTPTRFVRVFRELWQSLPLTAKRAICAYRRANPGIIQIVEELRSSCAVAIAYFDRRHIEFLDACLLLPDNALRYTIAHELAHMYIYAVSSDWDQASDEDETDRIVDEWFGESDAEWWQTEGQVWIRYVCKMFSNVRLETKDEIANAPVDKA